MLADQDLVEGQSAGRTPPGMLEFGGPDLATRRLRDLLQAQVAASPAGSHIDWCTYYFRDQALAEALIRASDRGVHVRLVLEPDPRRKGANDAVIAMLRAHGLKGGFHLYNPSPFDDGHLHAKIYAFAEPDIAWIGSFNPSGDVPDDADVIAEIGDQDRGHNLLLGVENPKMVTALRNHVRRLGHWSPIPLRWRPSFNRVIDAGGMTLYFYPRKGDCPVELSVQQLKQGDRLRGAISHLKKGGLTAEMVKAVDRGVIVELLVHDTQRRVPHELVQDLAAKGIAIIRVRHPEHLPMHAKFLLVEQGSQRFSWIGSYNFNKKSRLRNAEVLLSSDDPSLFASLEDRFDRIASMAN